MLISNQIAGKGYSFVEVVSMCPTGWGMNTLKSVDWLEQEMLPYYPLGNFRDK